MVVELSAFLTRSICIGLKHIVERIERGRNRQWNLWNANDVMSWMLLGSLLLIVGGPATSVYLLREDIAQDRLAVETDRQNVDALLDQLYSTYSLKVATTRAELDPFGPPARRFGTDRSEIEFALANVSIPSNHRLGVLESPSVFSLYKEDPETQVVVRELTTTGREAVMAAASGPDGTPEPLLIFVHGWNISFADSMRRAAVTAYDLGFSGATLLFSWPSAGSMTGYAVDSENAVWSAPRFRDLLTDTLKAAGQRDVNIMAVDLGGRVAVEAIGGMTSTDLPLIENLLLLAPDVDVSVFNQLSAQIAGRVRTTTIYADPDSSVLKAAAQFSGAARLGSGAAPDAKFENVHLITVRTTDDFLGHGYFGEAPTALSDVFLVLKEGLEPSRRPRLRPTNLGWELTR